MILGNLIDIVSSVFTSGFTTAVFIPIFCLCFLACVPCILRHFILRR